MHEALGTGIHHARLAQYRQLIGRVGQSLAAGHQSALVTGTQVDHPLFACQPKRLGKNLNHRQHGAFARLGNGLARLA